MSFKIIYLCYDLSMLISNVLPSLSSKYLPLTSICTGLAPQARVTIFRAGFERRAPFGHALVFRLHIDRRGLIDPNREVPQKLNVLLCSLSCSQLRNVDPPTLCIPHGNTGFATLLCCFVEYRIEL